MEKKIIPVIGMSCASCSAHVERKLQMIEGVEQASVSLPSRTATVVFDPQTVTLQKLQKEVAGIGYDLVIEEDRSVVQLERQHYRHLLLRMCVSWALSLLCMSFSMQWLTLGNTDSDMQTMFIIALLNIVYCGGTFYRTAWKQLLHRSANMDTLIALSTFIAFLFSAALTFGAAEWLGMSTSAHHTYYDASVMIITFALTGRVLEERAKNATSHALRTLMGLAPKTARIVLGEEKHEVPIATLQKGDIVEVRPGEKIPVDGVITSLETPQVFIDESMVTGEPIPDSKALGSEVLAGTINKQGVFCFKARAVGEGTLLSNIIKMVQAAQNSKAPVQRTVDNIALVFVPVVLFLSIITFAVWYFLGDADALPHAVLSAVSVLVIACPCAMGLATPTALMVGMGKAAQNSILIKDATALEQICKVSAIVIDKTGTLTIPNQNIDFTSADEPAFEERETLKPYAREAMQALQKQGIEVYMMSGDKEDAARYWAEKAGIAHYQSKVLPQDKENLVRHLQAEGHHVAMIGDGINDSQALAAADVSIAMGKGTDIAIDIAQATLIGNDLRKIVYAILLSRKTVSAIRQNLFWAFIYNLVCIPLAAGVPMLFGIHFQITPMWASALMALSSVSVVLNSLRLKYVKIDTLA